MQTTQHPTQFSSRSSIRPLLSRIVFVVALACGFIFPAPSATHAARTPVTDFGYGWSVAYWPGFQNGSQSTSFNWIKVSEEPGDPNWLCSPNRLNYNVLLRLNRAKYSDSVQAVADHARNWATWMYRNGNPCVEAFEIGNEVNLNASWAGNGVPDPQAYVDRLCAAYRAIKGVSPNYIVVSAGLAPVGRVQGSTNGYSGNNGQVMDDQEFVRQMLNRGAASCFDTLGYHNYGFASGPTAAPGSPECGPNDFCFRGVERIRDIMVAKGVTKPIWSTEFGWLRDPTPDGCQNDPSFSGRQWYFVSAQTQADNLVGAFRYARANMPWLGAMFVFNLDFNSVGWYARCDSIRYFGVDGKPAEAALESMPKSPSATATPTTAPAPVGQGTGLVGAYYNSRDLTGLVLSRTDSQVNFNWGGGSPASGVNADNFSVRWTGKVEPRYSGAHTFYANSDDGVRLWVNGQKLIDNWTDHAATENSGTINLTAGQRYDLVLEYYENGGEAVITLAWSSASQPKQVIPQSQLYPTQPPPQATATPGTGPAPTPIPPPSGSDLIFADGFESGNFSAWTARVDDENDLSVSPAAALRGGQGMAALIDNGTAMYLRDGTPANEARYRARFYLDPNSLTMPGGSSFRLFVARGSGGADVVRIDMRFASGAYQLRATTRTDGGSYVATNWFTISDAPHPVEFDWLAATAGGANNGTLSLWIDGTLVQSLSGLDNGGMRVAQARLGPLASIDSGTNGTVLFDDFVSRRSSYIGP